MFNCSRRAIRWGLRFITTAVTCPTRTSRSRPTTGFIRTRRTTRRSSTSTIFCSITLRTRRCRTVVRTDVCSSIRGHTIEVCSPCAAAVFNRVLAYCRTVRRLRLVRRGVTTCCVRVIRTYRTIRATRYTWRSQIFARIACSGCTLAYCFRCRTIVSGTNTAARRVRRRNIVTRGACNLAIIAVVVVGCRCCVCGLVIRVDTCADRGC